MSGNLWCVWQLPDEAKGSPPACLAYSRWAERGLVTFWQHAFEREPGGDRLALVIDSGATMVLPPGWWGRPGAERFRRWAAEDAQLYKTLSEFHWGVAPHDEGGLGSGSVAFVDALFAPALAAASGRELAAAMSAPEHAFELPSEPGARPAPPRLPPAPPLAEALAAMDDAELPEWPAALLARLPNSARPVTPRHRSAGMPPPGALFWSVPEGQGWVVLSRPELYDLEAARGRPPSNRSHIEGEVTPPTDEVHGSALARYNSFPNTYRGGPLRFELDGIVTLFDLWWKPMHFLPPGRASLVTLGVDAAGL